MKNFMGHKFQYHLQPLFFLMLILVFFYFPVLFLGKTLQGPEMMQMNINLRSPQQFEDILHFKTPPIIFNSEQVSSSNFSLPNDYLIGQQYRQKYLPLWNSHQGLGAPLAAEYQTLPFFPLQVIQNLFPLSAADFFYILYAWFAGVFTYCFFITVGLNRISAFTGGCLYMCSGAFTWFLPLEMFTSVSMMLPLLMLATHKLTQKNSGIHIVFLAMVFGLMLYTGHPEVILYAFTLSFCYFIYKWSLIHRELKCKYLFAFFCAGLLGLAFALPQILLTFQLYQHAVTTHSGNIHQLPHIVMGIEDRTKPYLLSGIIFPKFLDFPNAPMVLPGALNWDRLGGYLTFLPIFFIIFSFFTKKSPLKQNVLFFTIFAVAILLLDIGYWPFSWIGYLPLFRQTWSPRWAGPTWSFALISAFTYGFYLAQQCQISDNTRKKIIESVVICMLFLLAFCVIFYIPHISHSAQIVSSVVFSAIFSLLSLILLGYFVLKRHDHPYCWIACTLIIIVSLWYNLPQGICFSLFLRGFSGVTNIIITDIIYLLISLLLLSISLYLINSRIIKSVVIFTGIFCISILLYQQVVPGYPKYQAIEKAPPFAQWLQKESKYNRIFGFNGVLIPSYATVYGLYDIRYMSAFAITSLHNFVQCYIQDQVVPVYTSIFDGNFRLPGFPFKDFNFAAPFRSTFLKAISLVGVKYIITPKRENEEFMRQIYPEIGNKLKNVYSDDYVNIYENSHALPRTFVVSNYQFANTFQDAQKIAMSPNFNIANTVVLEKNIPLTADNNSISLHASSTITQYNEESVTIHYESNKAAILVLSDIYYPGWNATVDGKSTAIYRVDGLIRGVLISPGKHIVEFYYKPTIFRWGLWCMLASTILCLFILFFGIIKKSKQKNNTL